MTKISTLSDYIATTPSPFLYKSATDINEVPDFIKDDVFQNNLKRYMEINFGEYCLLYMYKLDPVSASNLIPLRLNYQYIANAYMLEGLWNSTQLDYNPIENYRMEEKGKETNSGSDTTTRNFGNTNVQQIAGERNDIMSYGSYENTNTHEVSPESSANYIAESRDKINNGTHIDNATTGSQTITTKSDAVNNTDTLKHGHILDHELTRSGNIGVTTSQQMIQSEREIVKLNVYKVVADLVLGTICQLVTTDF